MRSAIVSRVPPDEAAGIFAHSPVVTRVHTRLHNGPNPSSSLTQATSGRADRGAGPDAVAEAARGTALAREGKYDRAIEHCEAALQLSAASGPASRAPASVNLSLSHCRSKPRRFVGSEGAAPLSFTRGVISLTGAEPAR